MEEFFTVPKLLEIGFNTLSAATALFVVANAEMYRSKKTGKDRVSVFQSA